MAVGSVATIGTALVPIRRFLPTAGAQAGTDAELAAFAESVELVAVTAYDAGLPMLSEELTPVLQTFRGHHQEHAEAYAALAGDAATGAPNAALLEALTPAIEDLGTQSAVLRFARDLENQLAVTCGHLLTVASAQDLATATATILPIESSHATALSYELDEGAEAWFPFGAGESVDLTFGFDPAAFPVGQS